MTATSQRKARRPGAIGRLIPPCILLACLCACTPQSSPSGAAPDAAPAIVPAPARITSSEGAFELHPSTPVGAAGGDDARRTARWLSDLLGRTHGLELESVDARTLPSQGSILLELGGLPEGAARESYRLEISPERIVVTANDAAGLFYGAVTLWQVVPLDVSDAGRVAIRASIIEDAPRFRWRGLMVDSARHFVPPEDIRRMIDWMSLHKLNVLHWHLTDDQGWRLEIRKYPRLTGVGAWRTPAHAAGAGRRAERYGGYYTQAEVRTIVDYAASRHVTIVPEIEMPGHAQAAIAAYHELGTVSDAPAVSADWGVHDYLFDVEDRTFAFLEDVLDEVMALFPGEYIHVGGDEAVKDRWRGSPSVQARMRALGVADETALQSWFVRRIEAYLDRHGRRLIGWDEILEGGLAPNATVMSWRGIDGALAAAAQGHDAVLTPAPTLYFDHRQAGLPGEPPGRGAVVTLGDVYAFDPLPGELAADERRHVLGVQANLWSEHIRTFERLAHMAFPRAAALSEVAWSAPERRSWPDFLERLARLFGHYRAIALPFAASAFRVAVDAGFVPDTGEVRLALSNQAGFGTIRYSTDGSRVTARSAEYRAPLELPPGAVLSTAVFHDGIELARSKHGDVGLLASRRFSQQLTLCSERLVLQLEDDAPVEGERAVFLIDIMNPCWQWPQADLSQVSGIEVTVGQLPFNFQIGDAREQIELREPKLAGGELEVRAGGCEGEVVARLPLEQARRRDTVTTLAGDLRPADASPADLCFRFNSATLEPMWAIRQVTLRRDTGAGD